MVDLKVESRGVKRSVLECVGHTPLVSLDRLFPEPGVQVMSKMELMNPGGSMKDRTARYMIQQGMREGKIRPGSHLIESSSGNLGIAVAMAARVLGLSFTCVVDPKTTATHIRILRRLGAGVEMVREPDKNGGYLDSRIRRVKELLHTIPDSFWINQYANENNWKAHYHGTAAEMADQLDRPVDVFFAAVSTTGSLLGCARRLREHFPSIRVVAVDAVGSVLFGGPPGKRELPGIGASRVPELFSPEEIDEVVHVDDREAARGCRELLEREGIFAGGSSGSVVAAIRKTLGKLPRPCRILTLFPDRGDRYLDLVYNDDWVDRLAAGQEEERTSIMGERV
ncbi:cysteine synthase A [Melghirimyces profundicolus]|uniref:N-(2-amino-2-carboxyethyl)-L-glutamate synthase n=1 Tax=Melghirimyces profundicolus TaxID=1242148 RepID=A0A2T6C8P5_9BACL|nr:2,3-diaminopropionate biosynthesis protein SbnA [Melghirimyces profundicolus]PTX64691.1 cysteine synthase A [Melghirimyces profundicolus]